MKSAWYWCNRRMPSVSWACKNHEKGSERNVESVLCIWRVWMDSVVHFKVGQLECAKPFLSPSCTTEPLSSKTLPHCPLSLLPIYARWITPLLYGRLPADSGDAASPFGNSSSLFQWLTPALRHWLLGCNHVQTSQLTLLTYISFCLCVWLGLVFKINCSVMFQPPNEHYQLRDSLIWF